MIITRIRAENVLKYVRLELNELPARGLIAVIGQNESGKSSIGESICFALFGRTFSLDLQDLDKIIRWGESRCSIRLDFTTPDGQAYQIARFLDALGNHSASLSRLGEEPLVRGVEETAAALKDLIGFGYTEMIESFYLAQREITTPNPHSFAVRVMAGVEALEKVAASCRREIAEAQQRIADTGLQKTDMEARLQALGFDLARLAELEDEHAACERQLEDGRLRTRRLKTVCEHNEASLTALKDAAANWLSISLQATLRERRQQARALATVVAGLEPMYGRDDLTANAFVRMANFARDQEDRLASIQHLFDKAAGYRRHLAGLLGLEETAGPGAPVADALSAEEADLAAALGDPGPPFAARRHRLEQAQRGVARARNGMRLGALALLLPVFMALGLWGLGQFPETVQAQAVSAWWTAALGEDKRALAWLPQVAAGCGLLAGLLAWRGARLSARVAALDREVGQLEAQRAVAQADHAALQDLEKTSLVGAYERLQALGEPTLAHQAQQGEADLAWLDATANEEGKQAFRRVLQPLEKAILAMKRGASAEIEQLQEGIMERTGRLARLASLLEREHERQRQHDEMTQIVTALSERIDEDRHRVQVRDLGLDLLDGAIHYISQRFNTEIRNLAADSLPKFTNGRYEHLQIDEHLKVKAFSNEKRNFMELDEISSGTQRQIMLAVRLALSQKLVNSVIQGPQMLFLDEPFAFFDEARTASSLAVLPQVSGDFTQIWVTSQTFPPQSRFDFFIECHAAMSVSPQVWRDREAAAGAG